ncbi:MAG TPA: dTDP-glucose 4,6-dehydratase [Nitrospirales bacterium]|nr:dTDP-glucose 4,6-dehydratase [Nitrospirales bacterium]
MMRLLVTGGAGFIGSHLVRLLLTELGHTVVNLDALRYSGNLANLRDVERHPHYAFVQADICDGTAVTAALRDHRIEAVINCAAETHVDRSILDPHSFAKTDVVGTAVLLEAARQAGVQRFVQVSTDEVYGSIEDGAARESDPLRPRSPYAASKAGGDLLVQSYWTTYRFPVLITRGSNTYGPNQYPEKFIPLFITNAIDGQPLPLYGDGRYRRDWLAVRDHCTGIVRVLTGGEPGTVYNVGGGNERENLDVATRILEQLGRPRSLIRHVEDRPGHDRRYAIDSARLHALGWRPSVVFESGLSDTVRWYQANEPWWRTIKSGEFRAYYEQMYRQRIDRGVQVSG